MECLVQMAFRGRTSIFLKVTLPKFGIFRFALPAGATADDVRAVLSEEIDYEMIYVEGRPDTFLARELVPMYFEYRVFVINGQAVTGADAIEEHTRWTTPALQHAGQERPGDRQ